MSRLMLIFPLRAMILCSLPGLMVDLKELIQQGRAERLAFRQRGELSSPACVELMRRAFAGEEASWDAVFSHVFVDDIERFIDAAAQQLTSKSGLHLNAEDRQDALQEARRAFWRYAPQASTLLHSDELAPIITYLQRCIKTGVAIIAREKRKHIWSVTSPGDFEQDDLLHASYPDIEETVLSVQSIVDELKKILETDEERLVAQKCFLDETPPRELVQDLWEQIPGEAEKDKIKYINNVLQRIRRRATHSPYFQELRNSRRKTTGTAFLILHSGDFSDSEEAKMPQNTPCPYDEATLLDYLYGAAPPEIHAAIERSPACVEAARMLREDIQTLTPYLRHLLCPDVDTLVDYQEKRLPGVQQLVIDRHVRQCHQCQAEIAMFQAIDEVPLQDEPSRIKRWFEALLLHPTLAAAPARGGILYRTQFRTPVIDILISTRKASGKPLRWIMRIDLRTEDGVRFPGVESILLDNLDSPATSPIPAIGEAEGSFVARGLNAGRYSVRISTGDEEIYIRELVIGDNA